MTLIFFRVVISVVFAGFSVTNNKKSTRLVHITYGQHTRMGSDLSSTTMDPRKILSLHCTQHANGIYTRERTSQCPIQLSANRYRVQPILYPYFSYILSFFLSHRIKTTTAVHQRQIDVPSLLPCIRTDSVLPPNLHCM